jgi:AcrR family transcriptional regulator
MDKRPYVQRARAASSEETKRRVLAAARTRLEAGPLEALKVEEVARDAGVSRSTVYLLFGSRRGLFEALARWLRDEAGFGRLIEAYGQPDALRAFRDSSREGTRLYAAMPELARALFTLAAIDPDAVGAITALEDGRVPGMRSLAGRLADQGYLRPGVTTREAADVLTVATSFQAFDQLFGVLGLSPDQVTERLRAIVERTLLRPDLEPG